MLRKCTKFQKLFWDISLGYGQHVSFYTSLYWLYSEAIHVTAEHALALMVNFLSSLCDI